MSSRPRTTSFIDAQQSGSLNPGGSGGMKISSKDGNKVYLYFLYLYDNLTLVKFLLGTDLTE